jgi:hypothetical protein
MCKCSKISPHSCQHLLLFVFDHSHPNGCVYFIVVLICVCLMASEVEFLFICLLVICIYSLEKCLTDPLPIFKLFCLFIIEL